MSQPPDQQPKPRGDAYKVFKQGVTERNEQAFKDAKKRRETFDRLKATLRAESEAETTRRKP
jgi:hypothetical protein